MCLAQGRSAVNGSTRGGAGRRGLHPAGVVGSHQKTVDSQEFSFWTGRKVINVSPLLLFLAGRDVTCPPSGQTLPQKVNFWIRPCFFGHDPRQSSFRETRKRFIMGGGVAGFLLGLGLLVFSEMKSVYSWVFLFVLFWFANLAVFRPKKRRESFSRREECAILTAKRESKTREQKRFYGQLHARFTSTPYWCRWY